MVDVTGLQVKPLTDVGVAVAALGVGDAPTIGVGVRVGVVVDPLTLPTTIRSRSGAYAVSLYNLTVLLPAFSATVMGEDASGVVQLVPVIETVCAEPPLTLTEKLRVPLTTP